MINKSNAELCASLNFSFDEANELFSTESLTSMQTAKISGGMSTSEKLIRAIDLFFKLYDIGVIIYNKIKAYFDSKKTTISPDAQIDLSLTPTNGGMSANCVINNNGMYFSTSLLVAEAPCHYGSNGLINNSISGFTPKCLFSNPKFNLLIQFREERITPKEN